MKTSRWLAAGALLLVSAAAQARDDWEVYGGVEQFRWREFDDAGARLLEESGARYHVGVRVRRPVNPGSLAAVEGAAEWYFGTVDYDGQACNILSGVCVPSRSDTSYNGVRLDATFRVPIGSARKFEVFAGGGLDTWSREIADTPTASGGIEDWSMFYAKFGLGYRAAIQSGLAFEVGVKQPFNIEEEIDLGVTLNPRGASSLFARLSTQFERDGGRRWGVSIFYDSYRFRESNRVLVLTNLGLLQVWQPESTQDIVGVQFAASW